MPKRWLLLMFTVFALLAFVGCSDDDDSPTAPAADPYDTLVAAGAAWINNGAPGVLSAATVAAERETYTILDFRQTVHYGEGHIPGAIDVSLGNVLDLIDDDTIPTDKPFLAVCYTGQSAGHGVVALRMHGYEAYSLKWGMSDWHLSLDKWTTNCADLLTAPETMNNNGDLTTHDAPDLSEYDADTVVEERVDEMLAGGFQGISFSDMTTLEDYFIINYFGEDDYLGQGTSGVPGHIPGAYQFTPGSSLGADQMLDNLPTDMPIVVYCWTGQTSSQVTAYLNILGYEAYSLKFGSNNLFHTQLTGHKWTGTTNEFPLETNSSVLFETLVDAGIGWVNNGAPGVKGADEISMTLDDYTIVDVRQQGDYDLGHIPGAIHSSLGTLEADIGTTLPTDLPFLFACYTGQSAGHAVFAARALGYEAYSLKWGMSDWHTSLAFKWDDSTNDLLTSAETANNNGDLTTHDFPLIDGYELATVVEDRVGEMLAGGFQGISYADMVTAGIETYFIVNYFGEDDYLGQGTSGVPGHIPGAYQFTPGASLDMDEMLDNLPTDMPIVVYCWTGQTSSQITSYLNYLGYEAYSLKFGSNALFHTDLTGHKWNGTVNDFPLEAVIN